jgi:hypothetical protein
MATTARTEERRGTTVTVFENNDAGLFAYRDKYPNGLLFKVRQYCRLYPMQDERAWRYGRSLPYTPQEIREGYRRNVFSGGGAAIYAVPTAEMIQRRALLRVHWTGIVTVTRTSAHRKARLAMSMPLRRHLATLQPLRFGRSEG